MKKVIVLAAVISCAAAMTVSAADGKAVWNKEHCAMCHGADGKGHTRMGEKMGAKDFTDAKVQAELKDDAAIKAIKEGLKNKGGRTLMKPYANLSDDEIKSLVQYIRSFKK